MSTVKTETMPTAKRASDGDPGVMHGFGAEARLFLTPSKLKQYMALRGFIDFPSLCLSDISIYCNQFTHTSVVRAQTYTRAHTHTRTHIYIYIYIYTITAT